MKSKDVLSIILVLLLSASLYAQQADPTKIDEGTSSNLAQQARNPTAALTQFQVVPSYNSSFYNLQDADQVRIVLNPVIPFKTGKLQHIARITIPIVVDGPDWGSLDDASLGSSPPPNYVPTADKTGLSDIVLFDLLIFPGPWKGVKIAAGISAILPTATDPALGTEKWSAGPAFGGLVSSGKLLAGGMILTNFSFAGNSERADVKAMSIQPFGSYGLDKGWSVELSEMIFGYDFNGNSWTSIPLGVRIGWLKSIGNLPVRFFADAEHNFADSGVAPIWTFRLGIVPLL